MDKNEIEEFITNFKKVFKGSEEMIESMFTNGWCYHFTSILKDVFPNGSVVLDDINNHFMYYYEGNFYDITGKLKVNYDLFRGFVDWEELREEYKKISHVYDNHYDIVRRCCVEMKNE